MGLPGDLSSSSRFVKAAFTRVDMHREDLDADALVHYPLVTGQQINMQN
ncbi:linear amide C-N hydrolase [Microbacterium sp. 1262]